MPDEWVTELANAVYYETLAGMLPPRQHAALVPGVLIAASTPLGFLPDANGANRPVIAREDGYLVATCYDPRSNRTTLMLAPLGVSP